MDIKDVCNVCGDILNDVADSINRNDYSGLSNRINHTVNQVVDQVKVEVKNNFNQNNWNHQNNYREFHGNQTMGYRSINQQTNQGRQVPARSYRHEIVTSKPAGRIVGPIQLACGIVFSSSFGIAALVMFILFTALAGKVFGILFLIFGACAIFSAGNIASGAKKIGLVNRFKRYTRLIGQRNYIEVKELAMATGMKKEKVVKDLEKMIQKNMFLQGRWDKKKTTLMLTQDVYQQYVDAEKWRESQLETQAEMEKLKLQMAAKKNEKKPAEEPKKSMYDEPVQKILDSGEEYIRTVRKCNDDIPNEEMSDKLYKLENIMSRIFEQVKKNPSSADDLHKLMDYYLPTTIKLLNAYIDMDKQAIDGNNISTAKKEIEEVMDTINIAFEKLLDSMFEDTAWDISSDISVMKTMMKQEGLTENKDFQ